MSKLKNNSSHNLLHLGYLSRGKVCHNLNIKYVQHHKIQIILYNYPFYRGKKSCSVLTYNLDEKRYLKAHPKDFSRVEAIVNNVDHLEDSIITERYEYLDEEDEQLEVKVKTKLATPEDAKRLAKLIDLTFDDYPTPSHDPEYIRKQIESGVPFRFVEDGGKIVACASADLVSEAMTAELTDCATLPEYRKNGYMRILLTDLMWDLQQRDYYTAFSFARARIPGINILFKKLGFEFCGSIHQSCRIGDGLEDMNIWFRKLPNL